jgi:hypothetical protein
MGSAKECTRNGLRNGTTSAAGLPGVSLPGADTAESAAVQGRKTTERTGKGETADPRLSALNNTSSDGGDAGDSLPTAQPGTGGDGSDDDEVLPPAPAGARDGGDTCDGSDGEIQSIAAGIVAAWQAAGRRCDAATEVAVADVAGRVVEWLAAEPRVVADVPRAIHCLGVNLREAAWIDGKPGIHGPGWLMIRGDDGQHYASQVISGRFGGQNLWGDEAYRASLLTRGCRVMTPRGAATFKSRIDAEQLFVAFDDGEPGYVRAAEVQVLGEGDHGLD